MTEYSIVYVTVPNQETGEKIARALVSERLAACANLVPVLQSIYQWEGKIEQSPEVLMIIKTVSSQFGTLCERVKALHPYDVPEIIRFPIAEGYPPYLAWIKAGVGPR